MPGIPENPKSEIGKTYRVGDTIQMDGIKVTIPDNELGRLLVAAKEYANSIDTLVAIMFRESDGDMVSIDKLQFVTPQEIEAERR